MLSAGKIKIMGVNFYLSDNGDRSLSIERIEVVQNERRRGLAKVSLKRLVEIAGSEGIKLSAQIFPDDHQNDALAIGLQKMCKDSGFVALEMDGEKYRNDVSFTPSSKKILARCEVSIKR